MSTFYTDVSQRGDTLYVRGVHNDKRFVKQTKFKPTLYLPSNNSNAEYKGLMGENLDKKVFNSIKDAKNSINDYSGVSNFKVFGNDNWVCQFIAQNFKGEIKYDPSQIRVFNLDIEVQSGLTFGENGEFLQDKTSGFPKPDEAKHPITLIGLYDSFTKRFQIWGYGNGKDDYVKSKHFENIKKYGGQHDLNPDDIDYHSCKDEKELLVQFLSYWTINTPDVYTGWNIDKFDTPYIYNRITQLLGSDSVKKLSPYGRIKEKNKEDDYGNAYTEYDIVGVAQLDYIKLYKKFTYSEQESYRLDHIANVELGDGKLSYEESGSLKKLFHDNYQKYTEYNAVDILCVQRLENKFRFIELVYTIAYYAKINYEDVLGTIKPWDSIIYNNLLENNIIIPPRGKKADKTRKFAGAYVKDPLTGKKKWVVSVDLNSLYPHLIMQYNIGTETRVPLHLLPEELRVWRENLFMYDFDSLGDPIIEGERGREAWLDRLTRMEVDLSLAKKYNLAFASNGEFYTKEKPSFLNTIMDGLYKGRKIEKKKMLKYEQELVYMKKELEARTNGKTAKIGMINSSGTVDRGGVEIEAKFTFDECLSDSELNLRIAQTENEIARLDGLQMALKILLNSGYGALGNSASRYFEIAMAESITLSGQANIKYIAHCLSDEINRMEGRKLSDYQDRIIAIDTDSNYLDCSGIVDIYSKKYKAKHGKEPTTDDITNWLDAIFAKHFEPFIDKSYRDFADYQNAYEHKMFMAREVIAESAMWTKKKRYIMKILDSEGVRFAKPKYKVMGQDAIRSSTPEICRDMLKDAYKVILDGDEPTMQEFIRVFREEHQKLSPHIIATNSSANGLAKYSNKNTVYEKGTPGHVRGALLYNNFLDKLGLTTVDKIQEGEKVKVLALREPNMLKYKTVSFPQFLDESLDLHKYVDHKTMFEKTFIKPLTPLLDLLGWSAVKKASLNSMFAAFGKK